MGRRHSSPLADLVAYRESWGETQAKFWSLFRATNSGGSRYESGRTVLMLAEVTWR